MFNLSALTNVLNSIDNVAKETLSEEGKVSATLIRQQRNSKSGTKIEQAQDELVTGIDNDSDAPSDSVDNKTPHETNSILVRSSRSNSRDIAPIQNNNSQTNVSSSSHDSHDLPPRVPSRNELAILTPGSILNLIFTAYYFYLS